MGRFGDRSVNHPVRVELPRPDPNVPISSARELIAPAQLESRIAELGQGIATDLGGSGPTPLLIAVLKGSTLFLADLIRAIPADIAVDAMSISSYGAPDSSSGVVRIVKDLDEDIAGRDVLIVEDIVDTGLTLTYLRRSLEQRGPKSLRTVALLDKTARRIVPVPVEYVGFEIPDVFVVGYGLDFQGLYRNLPSILAVTDLARLANDPRLLVGSAYAANSPIG